MIIKGIIYCTLGLITTFGPIAYGIYIVCSNKNTPEKTIETEEKTLTPEEDEKIISDIVNRDRLNVPQRKKKRKKHKKNGDVKKPSGGQRRIRQNKRSINGEKIK